MCKWAANLIYKKSDHTFSSNCHFKMMIDRLAQSTHRYAIFCCSLHKKRVNQIEDAEADTLEYDLINTFYYQAELSGDLTGNEIITTAHPCKNTSYYAYQYACAKRIYSKQLFTSNSDYVHGVGCEC